jgi:uncharacterized protein YdiU (UPF0061 family)
VLALAPPAYAALPARAFVRQSPDPVPAPAVVRVNRALAEELSLDVDPADAAALFSGNALPVGAAPIATAYAGHQFGHFVPQLGDGRAVLLGDARDRTGTLREVQLKGAGRTPFSRGGDGRAAIGPVLREYLVSEAMHALGIPTTRALAAVTTGATVHRATPLPGAILTRVAASHVRVGTVQYFAARGDLASLTAVADFVVARHYPDAASARRPYVALLDAVVARQAELVARWMHVGFVHGVMNTDNMAISGETLDFGPCASLDDFDPRTVFSSIDHGGRYSYAEQPRAAQWNLTRLAEALIPLLADDDAAAVAVANEVLATFPPRFADAWLAGMRRKLGFADEEDGDLALAEDLLARMHRQRADFTLTFRRLADAVSGPGAAIPFADPAVFEDWAVGWRARLARGPGTPADHAARIRGANPACIPRNHRIEQAIAAAEGGDLGPFEALHAVLARPYDDPAATEYQAPPRPEERVLQTFCGT